MKVLQEQQSNRINKISRRLSRDDLVILKNFKKDEFFTKSVGHKDMIRNPRSFSPKLGVEKQTHCLESSSHINSSSNGGTSMDFSDSNSSKSFSTTSSSGNESYETTIIKDVDKKPLNGGSEEKKYTAPKPFKLRTEERGKQKVEKLTENVLRSLEQEHRQRIRVAQGLPLTTDEPEIVPKPPVKDITRPMDLELRSQRRASQRAVFDHLLEIKARYIELQKLEQQRLRKLAEEEEIKRLRKQMVPKAQLLPYFDNPFKPKKSTRRPTIPKEPKLGVLEKSNSRK